jgi:hypothetical protein
VLPLAVGAVVPLAHAPPRRLGVGPSWRLHDAAHKKTLPALLVMSRLTPLSCCLLTLSVAVLTGFVPGLGCLPLGWSREGCWEAPRGCL